MSINIQKVKRLPDTPGVYFFLGRNKKILYIGKATSLRDRVRSYFAKDWRTTRGPLLVGMLGKATSIDHKQAESVIEALLLEADLIRKFKPEFNTMAKDDKSFNCVVITKEDFPVIKLVRKKNVIEGEPRRKVGVPTSIASSGYKYVFGPYTEGASIKEALKIIRKIFPYRDEKCKLNSKRPCFNYNIGLCPGTCIGAITKSDYAKTIRNISLFFQGKKKRLVSTLKREMKTASKNQDFEKAGKIRNQIFALEHIRDVSMIKNTQRTDLFPDPRSVLGVFRIESYDIAHMAGGAMVGVMTVLENGEFNKNEYRKFKIRKFNKSNDTGALKEVLLRRLNHSEWKMPNLVVLDGGKAQLNLGKAIFDRLNIPVLSVVKDEKHKMRDILGDSETVRTKRRDIEKINAETHRFAIAYHRGKLRKSFIV